MAIIRDRDLIENGIPVELIASCIKEHQEGIIRLNKLDEYYQGKHAILERPSDEDKGLPNNKLVANHAKNITDIATGYVFGKPIKYEGEQIEAITEAYKTIDIVSHDSELAKDLSVFGRGLELYFMSSDDEPIPKVSVIDPRQIFLVVDDTVEYKPMFGVHYYEKRDIDNEVIGFKVFVYSDTNVVEYFIEKVDSKDFTSVKEVTHYWGAVPIMEFINNEEEQGDFEQQISLIDAYNLLQPDRVNDKEQLVDALLKVTGVSFGDDEEEQSATARMIKKHKIMEIFELFEKDYVQSAVANLYDLAEDVLIKAGVLKYFIDPTLKSIPTNGFIDKVTYRKALQCIGIASKSAVYQDRNGTVIIKPFVILDESTSYIYFAGPDMFTGMTIPTVNSGYDMLNITFDNVYYEPQIKLDKLIQSLVMTLYVGGNKEERTFMNADVKEGASMKCDNPLINSVSHAADIAQWIIDESNLRALYQVNWRQNPALECGDIVFVEDSFGAEKQSRITKQEFEFAGYLSGKTETKGGV